MTIYEKTNTTVSEVLKAMIIRPKYIQLIGNTINKTYNVETNENLNHYREYFTRKNTLVTNLDYNKATKILKIFVK